VLIIDEVLSVGDLAFQEKCYERMQTFVRSGIAVVLVSHNLSAIATLCERTMVLRKGRPEAVMPTHDAITLYTTLVQDERADLGERAVHMTVLDADGVRATQVEAGAPLTVCVRTGRPPSGERFLGELHIRHVESGTTIYRGQSPAAGGAAQSPGPDQEIELLWKIRANLGRGHYSVRCAILNELHRWVALSPSQLITVNERQSEQGVIFLEASCTTCLIERTCR
jgi:energy-coupling factor transporter ATP-binding protein EcfA2